MAHMKISFDQAQKALGHLRNPQQGEKPPLLGVKGWEKSKKIYHLKDDLETAFKAEIDRFQDLVKEQQKLRQKAQENGKVGDMQKKFDAINEAVEELLAQEHEIELTGGKLTEEEFGDVIDSGIFIDLEFAIETSD